MVSRLLFQFSVDFYSLIGLILLLIAVALVIVVLSTRRG
jgi:hypothetical protein